ncbi:MAG TPA: nuclear transport factor 2 family protein [Candidatus Binataceae bacterium]
MANISGTLEDREEIRELYARYAMTIDNADYDAWVDCFTEDGTFESTRFGKHTGAQGLRRFTAIYRESLGGAQVRHVITNLTFQLDGESGTGNCYLLYYHCKDMKVQQMAVGQYRDRLRKSNGKWLFESRQVILDGHR